MLVLPRTPRRAFETPPRAGLAACCAGIAAAGLLAAQGAAASPTPPERTKQAQAQRVLDQVQALDTRMEHVVQAWDGARLELAAVKQEVAANRIALARARAAQARTRGRLAEMLVHIYESGEPSAVEVVLGAGTLRDVIDGLEFAQAVAREDTRLAAAAAAATRRYDRRRRALTRAEARQRATVEQLAGSRAQIAAGISTRQRLLASIRTRIAQLQARQRARERTLAAEARARLAQEQQRLAADRARAHTARAHTTPVHPAPEPQAPATSAPETTSVPAATGSTSQPAPTAPVPAAAPAGAPAPAAPAPAPHPEAAAIAARYLGVPYLWGGATPAGFDCSGLVSYVYAQLGVSLPHYTVAQWNATTPIPTSSMQPGDLVFFDSLSHVGIYIGSGQFIHAPHTGDVVRVSSLTGAYASSFVGARRP